MRIKKKFDILTLSIILLFLFSLVISYISNSYVFHRTLELVNISREFDFLTALKTSLLHLDMNIETYISTSSRPNREQVEQAMQEVYSFVGRSKNFRMDEDEADMMLYLAQNISRFHALVQMILSSDDPAERQALHESLRVKLFRRIGREIEEHWSEDAEKIREAEAAADRARRHSFLIFTGTFLILISAAFGMRTMIKKKFVAPILDLSSMSYRMAGGSLDKEIHLTSRDELEELARNFNFMAASLREKMEVLERAIEKEQKAVRELAILNEFTALISSELNMQIVFRTFIERTRDLMKAEFCAVFLPSTEAKKSFVSTDSLLTEEAARGLFGPDGRDLETVIAEQRPVRRNDLLAVLDDGRPLSNFIAFPLFAPSGMQCLLIVINGPGRLTEEAEDTLFNFAFQAFQTVALQNEVSKLATTDGLTGLLNHRSFQNCLSDETLRAIRYQRSLSLIIIDIDHFKRFNDTFGHQTGDDVLKVIGRTIRAAVRSMDHPSRYGGEEFVIILPECDCQSAYAIAERIRGSISENPFYLKDGTLINLTVSAGVSCLPSDATTKEDLMRTADIALYSAKNLGRNRVCLYRDTLQGSRQ